MIYATSDLHGYPLDKFLQLLEKAGFSDSDCLYVLGDVIDRNGEGGIAALRWMMRQPNVKFILGNHEAMLLSCTFLFDEITDESADSLNYDQLSLLLQWMRNGAHPTIESLRQLKAEDPGELEALLEYLRGAQLYATADAGGREFLLVHSGLGNFDPGKKFSEYTADELTWTRPGPGTRYFPDVLTIFGHTPTKYISGETGRMFRTETWIDIDTGAAGGGSPMLLRLDDLKEFYADDWADS